MNYENEIWKPVLRYETRYEISNYGRVRSLARTINGILNGKPTKKFYEGRLRVSPKKRNGYLGIVLDEKNFFIHHRLVAEVHILNGEHIPCGMVINHKDFDRGNNHADNLEVVTYSENSQHALKNGRMNFVRGEDVITAKLSNFQIHEMRWLKLSFDYDHRTLSAIYGVSKNYIGKILRGKVRK